METESGHDHRAAVTVVAGVADVLEICRNGDTAPEVQRVIAFEDLLRAVVECPITEIGMEGMSSPRVSTHGVSSVGEGGRCQLDLFGTAAASIRV